MPCPPAAEGKPRTEAGRVDPGGGAGDLPQRLGVRRGGVEHHGYPHQPLAADGCRLYRRLVGIAGRAVKGGGQWSRLLMLKG